MVGPVLQVKSDQTHQDCGEEVQEDHEVKKAVDDPALPLFTLAERDLLPSHQLLLFPGALQLRPALEGDAQDEVGELLLVDVPVDADHEVGEAVAEDHLVEVGPAEVNLGETRIQGDPHPDVEGEGAVLLKVPAPLLEDGVVEVEVEEGAGGGHVVGGAELANAELSVGEGAGDGVGVEHGGGVGQEDLQDTLQVLLDGEDAEGGEGFLFVSAVEEVQEDEDVNALEEEKVNQNKEVVEVGYAPRKMGQLFRDLLQLT